MWKHQHIRSSYASGADVAAAVVVAFALDAFAAFATAAKLHAMVLDKASLKVTIFVDLVQ